MKCKTLHKYIKYTDIPYSDILKRAKKSKAMKVEELDGGNRFTDLDGYVITLYWHNPKNMDDGVAVGFRNW